MSLRQDEGVVSHRLPMYKLGLTLPTLAASLLVSWLTPLLPSQAAEPTPTPAAPIPTGNVESTRSVQRLIEMFSPEIQRTLQACWDEGRADLGAGADADGLLQCGNGHRSPDVKYSDYVNTVSDLFVASSLVGFRTAIAADPQLTPQLLSQFLQQPEGAALLQQSIQMAVQQSQLVSLNSATSTDLLTTEVLARMMPVLSSPTQFDTLLGTPEQYEQAVTHFCTAPGLSIHDAQALLPELTSIQLYAICVEESGIANDVLRLVNP